MLAIWEVLGHLDILVDRGTLSEDVDATGTSFLPSDGRLEIAAASS